MIETKNIVPDCTDVGVGLLSRETLFKKKTSLVVGGTRNQVLADSMAVAVGCWHWSLVVEWINFITKEEKYPWSLV